MGTKRRCPTCGAKNDMDVRRCRMCTAVINADAPENGTPAEVPPPPAALDNHFDAAVIDRQLQPTRSKFGGGGGALAARLAAANGGEVPASYAIPSSSSSPSSPFGAEPGDDGSRPGPPPFAAAEPRDEAPFDPSLASELAPPGPPTAPPIEYEAEPFDPDALFRDLG